MNISVALAATARLRAALKRHARLKKPSTQSTSVLKAAADAVRAALAAIGT